MEGLQLIRVGFDSMENHTPEYQEVIATFVDGKDENAHKKCSDYISKLKPNLYLGYNRTVYPIFKIKTIEIL